MVSDSRAAAATEAARLARRHRAGARGQDRGDPRDRDRGEPRRAGARRPRKPTRSAPKQRRSWPRPLLRRVSAGVAAQGHRRTGNAEPAKSATPEVAARRAPAPAIRLRAGPASSPEPAAHLPAPRCNRCRPRPPRPAVAGRPGSQTPQCRCRPKPRTGHERIPLRYERNDAHTNGTTVEPRPHATAHRRDRTSADSRRTRSSRRAPRPRRRPRSTWSRHPSSSGAGASSDGR